MIGLKIFCLKNYQILSRVELINNYLMTETKKLYRSKSDRIIAGVCGGLGEYLEIDSVFIRLAFVLLTIFGGAGILIYLVMFLVIPEEDSGAAKEEKVASIDEDKKSATKLPKLHRGRVIVAFILILLGLLFLSNNFFPSIFSFGKLWPLLLILLGIMVLTDKKRR